MTGLGDNMETTIKISCRNGKHNRPFSDIIKEISDKIDIFIANKKLDKKRIEYRGYKLKRKENTLELKYAFVNKDNPFLKSKRSRKGLNNAKS
jgi:hypothetical protein